MFRFLPILLLRCWLLSHLFYFSQAAYDIGFGSDEDLTSFVTRPEIKAPLFNITHKVGERVTPGYIFVAPYSLVQQDPHPRNYYQACSTGPHIYDVGGQLVWSGACRFRNQNACDFRLHHNQDGEERLSTIFTGYEDGLRSVASVLDSSYEFIQNFTVPELEKNFNMHEFNVVDGGRSALYLTFQADHADITELGLNITTGWVSRVGFREVDVTTGQTIFEWWNDGHISLRESVREPDFRELAGPYPICWNWFHGNSVDKNSDGDYLVSARFTDTVYKIGRNGELLWRLGGKKSSFHLSGFNFSKQHDARFISSSGDTEIISVFDNAMAAHPGSEFQPSSNHSSALIVELDKRSMIARVLRRIARPDNDLTQLRGNFQLLSNGHAFISWSDHSYISEHGLDDTLLLEGSFKSRRFVNYRAYKFNFTGRPHELPVLKAVAFGQTPETSTTTWYASWNGATEITEWRFYGLDASTGGSKLVGTALKDGFETQFSSDGFEQQVFAHALSKNGSVLGTTVVEEVFLPPHWGLESRTNATPDRPLTGDTKPTTKEAWKKDEL